MVEKLAILLRKIQDKSYGPQILSSIINVQDTIARDVGAEEEEAMALLGYLLKYKYVKFDPADGIIVNPEMDDETKCNFNILMRLV
jgi:hypothetical protein